MIEKRIICSVCRCPGVEELSTDKASILRYQLRDHGWTYRGGKDFCPHHRPKMSRALKSPVGISEDMRTMWVELIKQLDFNGKYDFENQLCMMFAADSSYLRSVLRKFLRCNFWNNYPYTYPKHIRKGDGFITVDKKHTMYFCDLEKPFNRADWPKISTKKFCKEFNLRNDRETQQRIGIFLRYLGYKKKRIRKGELDEWIYYLD